MVETREDIMERHHIIPRSRCKQFGIKTPSGNWNTTLVDETDHKLYHQLFKNKTPTEILLFLAENFWGGKK